jgi:hypothetical protein
MSSFALEWIAFFLGTVGTIFWATGRKFKGKSLEGWFWLASALVWIAFSIKESKYGLVARDLLGAMIYCWGIARAFRSDGAHRSDGAQAPGIVAQLPKKDCVDCCGSGVTGRQVPGVSRCSCR